MRKAATVVLFTALTFAAGPSYAAGCLKGAAVGAVGGHFVGKGHSVAGAALGCAVGHHRAKADARAQAQQQNAQAAQAQQAPNQPVPNK